MDNMAVIFVNSWEFHAGLIRVVVSTHSHLYFYLQKGHPELMIVISNMQSKQLDKSLWYVAMSSY